MTMYKTFTVGQRLTWDSEIWMISAMEAQTVTLTALSGRCRTTDWRSLATLWVAEEQPEASGELGEAGVGDVISALRLSEAAQLEDLVGHVLEVLTGYRSGQAATAAPDEPRAEYAPGVGLTQRYATKAAELDLSERTVRRMAERYQKDGTAGLIDGRQQRESNPFGRVDDRWIDAARAVLAEHTMASRPTKKLIAARVDARVRAEHGDDVPLPSPRTAMRVLDKLTRGTNAFHGSTKAKRSIANRPPTPYGRLVATRPGEFLMLDTTPLDVFALDRLTQRWCRCELTVAMDVCTRCIVALRLTPMSTKSVDAALVLFEAVNPSIDLHPDSQPLPYGGLPTTVFVDETKVDSDLLRLPSVAAETIVVDHGRIYLSQHLFAVCERLGISIQPARVQTPTDKPMCERWFRTVREGVLEPLPGYKGPDVHSRGDQPEQEAFYFIDELEQILREWVIEVYHRRPHRGLVLPDAPGVTLSPLQMFDRGVARAGTLRLPARADLALDFLPVIWRRIQHYGVDMAKLRYDDACLNPYRNAESPWPSRGGKWPFRYDPEDISTLFFQDPNTLVWHRVSWVRADEIGLPFSAEALRHAKRLAAEVPGDAFDEVAALSRLLERWGAGITQNVAERRIAIRLDEQRAPRQQARYHEVDDRPGAAVSFGLGLDGEGDDACTDVGDDDALDDLDGDFYGSAFRTVS
jgi:transposase InsO family protein